MRKELGKKKKRKKGKKKKKEKEQEKSVPWVGLLFVVVVLADYIEKTLLLHLRVNMQNMHIASIYFS